MENEKNKGRWLTLPFATGTLLEITEGRVYSPREHGIHHQKHHGGVDYATAMETPVLASHDGLAVASEQYAQAMYEDETDGGRRKPVIYQNKPVYMGYGRFVMIYSEENGYWTVYGHLAQIAKEIPLIYPVRAQDSKDWNSGFFRKSDAEILKYAQPIKRGDLVGLVGVSGLSWGYRESPGNHPLLTQWPSWDEPHLHFEVIKRGPNGEKLEQVDPYGRWTDATDYHVNDPGTLWLLDDRDRPLYAK